MNSIRVVSSFVVVAVLALCAGCSGSREVEVKGEAKAAPGSTVQGKVRVEVYELPSEQGKEEKLVDHIDLDQPGAFSKKLDISGDKIRVFALADANGDGACTSGEAWASSEAAIKDDDTIAPVSLELKVQPCPQPAATK